MPRASRRMTHPAKPSRRQVFLAVQACPFCPMHFGVAITMGCRAVQQAPISSQDKPNIEYKNGFSVQACVPQAH